MIYILFLLSALLTFLLPAMADAKQMFVRPFFACTEYGDGTVYGCAGAPGGAGAWKGLQSALFGSDPDLNLNPGDTLYVCGFFDGGNGVDIPDTSLTVTSAIVVDGDCPDDPGSILSANYRITSGWTGPDANGVYTHSGIGGISYMHIAQLVGGVPVRYPCIKSAAPDATWTAGCFWHDFSNSTLHVRPLNDVDPNTTRIYTTFNGVLYINGAAATIRNLTIYGLSSAQCIQLNNADGAIIEYNTIQWCATYAIEAASNSDSDDVIVRQNTIHESGNGIYLIADQSAGTHDRWTITGNTITDIEQPRYYVDFTMDAHGIGFQGGDDQVLSHNTISRVAGTCITGFDFAGISRKNTLIARNACRDIFTITPDANMLEIGIQINGINSGHNPDDVYGTVVTGNLVSHVTKACLELKSSEPTSQPHAIWANNTAVGCGIGLHWFDQPDGDTGFTFRNNIVSAIVNVQQESAGDTLTALRINNNIYRTDSPTSFVWDGDPLDFADWRTNSSQDSASSVTDPLFVSSTDYRTQAASPVRRAGAFVTPKCQDVRGRPCWSPPDIGAYQATSGDPALPRASR